MRLAALLLAAVVVSPAAAAEETYAFIGSTPEEGIGTLLDRSSVVRQDKVATASFLAVLRKTNGEDADYGLIRMAVNCDERTGRGLGGGVYRADGSVVREEGQESETWKPAHDDVERAAFAAACDSAVPEGAPSFGTISEALAWFRGAGS